ncbi:MAG: asparagine synthase (glutamine-hydrolyzing), partial [Cytophagaceae bacterium]|nr:asparagine synthase (glutamine-hydrolyzing) [Cytophagaceae bacterium]
MCGIAGYYTLSGNFERLNLEKMTRSLAHRGPDAEGIHFEKHAGLGHRRLSILDISDASNQPFYSSDKRYIIVYNGEVYNFRELKDSLSTHLRTTGDTEVILELYIKHGPSFLSMLNGMFAIAIYDTEKEELFISRDRLGVKPLYYYWDENLFLFASELKAFKCISGIPNMLNVDSSIFYDFLKLGYIPEPNTIYNNIKKFPSGTYYIIDKSGLTSKGYWVPEALYETNTLNNEITAKKQLKDILESSVKYRMISDVPFGTFLSGGIDSSLVTAIAQSISE